MRRVVENKYPARLLPQMFVLEVIIHQYVARMPHVEKLLLGSAGDHLHVGKVVRGPLQLLPLRPAAMGTSRKDDGIKVGHSLIEIYCVGYERKIAIESSGIPDPVPEFFRAERIFGFSRILSKQLSSREIKVGQHAVAIEK